MGINKHCHFIPTPSSISQVKQRKTIYTKTNDYDRSLYSESSFSNGCTTSNKQISSSPLKEHHSKLNVYYEGEMMTGMKAKKSKTILVLKKRGHFNKLKKRNQEDYDKFMEQRKNQSLTLSVHELKTRIDNLNELIIAKIPSLSKSLKCSPIKIYSSHEIVKKKEELVNEIQSEVENQCIIKEIPLNDKYIIHFLLALFIITTITLTFIIFNERTEIFTNFFYPNDNKRNSKRVFSLFRKTKIQTDKNMWEKLYKNMEDYFMTFF